MEVLRPFQYWTLRMSKHNMFALQHVITVYNDKFDPMDGIMGAVAEKKTQCKENLYFAVKVTQQKLSK